MTKLPKAHQSSQTETPSLTARGVVSIGEAATTLGVSVDTIRNWEKAGKITALRTPGGIRKFRLSEIQGLKRPIDAIKRSAEATPDYKEIPLLPYKPGKLRHAFQATKTASKYITITLFAAAAGLELLTLAHLASPQTAKNPLIAKAEKALISMIPQKQEKLITFSTQPQLANTPKPADFLILSKEGDVLGITTRSGEIQLNANLQVNGSLTGPDIINGIIAGDNVTVSGTISNPIISAVLPASLVNTINNVGGAITIAQGSDITISTTNSTITISNASDLSTVRSRGGCGTCLTDSDVADNLTISSAGHVSGTAVNSGIVPQAYGGTGLASYATGDLIYSNGGTLAPLNIGANNKILTMVGGVPTWADGTCLECLVQVPTSNTAGVPGANVVAPTATGIIPLTVRPTSGGGSANTLSFTSANGGTTYLRADNNGDFIFNDNLYLAGGTTYKIDPSGNANFARIDNIPIGTTSTAPANFTTIGATTVGSATFTGLTSTGNTVISSTAGTAVTMGNATSAFSLASSGLNVSNSGALTGVAAISTSGGYSQTGSSANTFTGTATFSNATYSALFQNGNVGVGTATPTGFFSVGSGSPFQITSAGIVSAAAGITSTGTITFSSVTNGGSAGILHGSAAGVLTSSPLNLAATANEVSGTLPRSNYGTGTSITPTNGQLLIGNSGTSSYNAGTLTQGSNMSITNGAGSITVGSSLTPTYTTVNGLTLTSNADGFSIAGGTSSRTLTVTGGNITLTGGGNTLTLTGSATANQDLRTSAAPTFASATLNATSNQIVLGTTTTTTISATTPSASRTFTIPDFGSNDTFAGLAATQTLTNKTISGGTLNTPTINGSAAISGGTINNTTIGASSPSTAAFTSLSSTGATTLGNGSSTVIIDSSSWDVTSAGLVSGISGVTFTSGNLAQTGSGTFATGTGAVTFNGDVTMAANKSLTIASGTFAQTYSSSSASNAQSLSFTNSNTGASSISIKGIDITLSNSTNTNSTNTLNGINFPAGSNNNSNVINGINFASATGFTNFLNSPSIVISSAGAITGSSISGSTNTLSNIPNSALTNSSITINPGTGISGGGTVSLGGTLAAFTNTGVLSLTGTSNQILVNAGTSAQTGAVTLTTPQNIATTSSPSFAGQTLTGTLTFSGATTDITTGTNEDLIISPNGTGKVSIGSTSTTSYFNVGTSNQFQVDTSGNIVKINNVTTSFPTSGQASGYILKNDGSGNFYWDYNGPVSSWSALLSPTSNLALSMGSTTTNFTWGATTGSSNLYNYTDTANNTGTGYLVNIVDANSSSLKPFHVGTSSVDSITVASTGAVGIGTTSPSALFSVGTGSAFQVNSSGQATFNPSTTTPIANITNSITSISNGSIGTWATQSTLPVVRALAPPIYYNNYAYIVGGNGGANVSTVYYAQMKADGSMGTWTTTTSLPATIQQAGGVATNGYMYVVGGNTGVLVSTVYSAKINADGTIASWNTLNTIPVAMRDLGVVASNNYLFVVGGFTTTALSTVYSAQINGNGTIGTWQTLASTLPVAKGVHATISYGGYIYVFGGTSNTGTTKLSTVYSAPVRTDGTLGTWATLNTMPALLYNFPASVIAANGYVYMVGGLNSADSIISTVYSAQLKSDGTIGTWATLNTLPVPLDETLVTTNNSYLFVIGGRTTGGGNVSTVYSAPLSSTALASNNSTTFTSGNLLDLWNNSSSKLSVDYAGNLTSQGYVASTGLTSTSTTLTAGSTGTYQTLANLPVLLAFHTSLTYNGYLYIIGGDNNGTITSTVYSAKINADGTIGGWSTLNTLPAVRYGFAAAIGNGYIFVAGGDNGSGAISTVYSAKINDNGTIGSWNTLNTLPALTSSFSAVTYNGYLFVAGGYNGSYLSTVYSAPINGNGTIGSWATLNTLPALTRNHAMATYNGYLFVIGGDVSGTGAVSTVYSTSFKPDGTIGTWATLNTLPQATNGHSAIVYNGYLIVSGGLSGGTYFSTVYSTQLKADGTIGTWATLNTLPKTVRSFSAVTANGYMFIPGGRDGSTYYSTVYSVPLQSDSFAFNATNTLTSGNVLDFWNGNSSVASLDYQGKLNTNVGIALNQTSTTPTANFTQSLNGLTAGSTGTYQTLTTLPQILSEASGVYYNGYIYLVGGLNTGTQLSTVYSAPVRSDGTLGAWSSLNTLPGIREFVGAAAGNGYLFALGGYNGSAATSTVYSAKINGDGTIGTWNTLNTLPQTMSLFVTLSTNGYLFIVSGDSSAGAAAGALSIVYSAQINGNGTIGTWQTLNTLPALTAMGNGATDGKYIFFGGGFNSSGTALSTLYSAAIKSDGTIGTWATLNTIPTVLYGSQFSVANGYLYATGGNNGSTLSTVYSAPINSDGTIGKWAAQNTLPAVRFSNTTVVGGGYLWTMGGSNGSAQTSTVYSTPLQSDAFAFGTTSQFTAGNLLDVWNNGQSKFSVDYAGNITATGTTLSQGNVTSQVNGIGAGGTGTYQTLTNLPSIISQHGTATYNGYVFVIGGNSGSVLSTVYSAPVKSDGTIGAWQTLNTLPAVTYRLSAVAANGYLFVAGGWNGTTTYSTVYSSKINADGTIGAWNTLNTLPAVNRSYGLAVNNGYIFVVGGTTGSNVSTVYSAQINGNGTIGTWATLNTLPVLVASHAVTVVNNYLFVTGGNVTTTGTVSTVYSAPLKNDGTIGTWATLNTLPTLLLDHSAVSYNGYLYVVGGNTGSISSNIYSAKVNSDGTLGTWATLNTLPTVLYLQPSIAVNGYLFMIGGKNASADLSTVYSTPLQSDAFVANTTQTHTAGNLVDVVQNGQSLASVDYAGRYSSVLGVTFNNTSTTPTANITQSLQGLGAGSTGSYQTLSDLPATVNSHAMVSYNGYLFSVGGFTSTVYSNKINADGTLSGWTRLTNLPAARAHHKAVAYNGYLFVIGGTPTGAASSSVSTVYSTKINADGTIGSWNTLNTLPVVNAMSSAVASNGYLFVLGGDSSGDGSVALSTVYSAAIKSDGTIGTWATLNTLPQVLNRLSAVTSNGYIIVSGGHSGSAAKSTVYSAPVKVDGTIGTWATLNTLPALIYGHGSVVYNGYIYVAGGVTFSTVYSAKINADGTLGTWATLNTMPGARYYSGVTTSNGYLYIAGGSDGSTSVSTVYATPLQSDAFAFNTLNTMTSGNLLDVWNQGTSKFSVDYTGNMSNTNLTLAGGSLVSTATTIGPGGTGSWQTLNNLPEKRWNSQLLYAGGYIFSIAGDNANTAQSTVYSAQVKADGTIGSWQTLTNLPVVLRHQDSVFYNGYIIVTGGCATSCTALSTIYSAKVNSDGTIGSWNTLNTLPTTLRLHATTVYNGYLFVAGGRNAAGTDLSTVYSAQINGNGTIGSWVTLNTLPIIDNQHSLVSSNGFLYFLNNGTTSVYYASIKADGTIGNWTTSSYAFPTSLSTAPVVVSNGYIYTVAGYNGSALSAVYSGKIAANGEVGPWVAQTPAPVVSLRASAIVANGYLIMAGGFDNNSTYYSTVYSTPLQSEALAINTSFGSNGNLLDLTNGQTSVAGVDNGGRFQTNSGVQINQTSTTPTANMISSVQGLSQGGIGSWQTVTNLPQTLHFPTVVGYNGYTYVIGGRNSSTDVSTVYSAKVNADGTLSPWISLNTLPQVMREHAAVVYNGYIFVTGGATISTVYSAKILTDGTISSWSTLNTLPQTVFDHASVAYNGYLYTIGGITATNAVSTIYSAPINGNGTIGSWTTLNTLPALVRSHVATVSNGYLFIAGGFNGSTAFSTVYSAPLKADGTIGTWSTLNTLPVTLYEQAITSSNGYLYILGGLNGSSYVSTIYAAQVKGDGTIGSWSTLNTLPQVMGRQGVAISNGYIVLTGGLTTGSTLLSTVYSTPLTSTAFAFNTINTYTNGNLVDLWNNSSSKFAVDYAGNVVAQGTLTTTGTGILNSNIQGIGAGSTGTYATLNTLPQLLIDHSMVSYNGYLYVLGGDTTSGNNVSTVYSAQIKADGTISNWSTLTPLPAINSNFGTVATNGYLFVVGGFNDSAAVSTVYSAKILDGGIIGSWTTLNTIPVLTQYLGLTSYNNYLFMVGGYTTSGTQFSTVYSAPINGNGTIGTWTALNTLPAVAAQVGTVATGGYLYVAGGYNGSSISTVYSAPIKSDGTIGTWATLNTLPVLNRLSTLTTAKGYLYMAGGIGGSNVYSALLKGDGTIGSWTTLNTMPVNVYSLGATISNGYLFLSGGFDGSNRLSTVYSTPLQSDAFALGVNPTGTALTAGNVLDVWNNNNSVFGVDYQGKINTASGVQINNSSTSPTANMISSLQGLGAGSTGTWQTLNNIPVTLNIHSTVASNGYVYLVGGHNGSAYVSTVYYAKQSADGTIGPWVTTTALPALNGYNKADIYNGYLFVTGGYTGSAVLSTVYSSKINADGTLSSWNTLNTLPALRQEHTAVASNGYLFILGGENDASNTLVSTVYSAQILGNGTIGTWQTLNTLPTLLSQHVSVAANGYLYIVGGLTTSGGTTVSTAYYAPIKADGTIGAWTSAGTIPATRRLHSGTFANGYLYIVGGYSGAYTSTIWSAELTKGGTFGTWSSMATLPSIVAYHKVVATNGYLYLTGGYNGSTYLSTVYSTPLQSSNFVFNTTNQFSNGNLIDVWNNNNQVAAIDATGKLITSIGIQTPNITSNVQGLAAGSTGTYQTLTNLPATLAGHATGTYNSYIFVAGGHNGSAYTSTVYSTKANADGTISGWRSLNTLPQIMAGATGITANGFFFIAGGYNGSAALSTVYSAKINEDGTLGSWNTLNTLPALLAESGSAFYNGYFYIIGGSTTGGSAGAISTVYSVSVNSNGTIGTWQTLNTIPALTWYPAVTVANGYIYVVGGRNSGGTNLSTVYSATLKVDGTIGAWATLNTLPQLSYSAVASYYNGYIYVTGGQAASALSTVYVAKANSTDGTIGTWATLNTLPQTIAEHDVSVVNGYLFIIGGINAAKLSTVYSTPLQSTALASNTSNLLTSGNLLDLWNNGASKFSVDYNGNLTAASVTAGTLASNVQGITAGSTGTYQTLANLPVLLRGQVSVTYNNYVYLFGGHNGSYLSTVYSAQIKVDGTLGGWQTLNTMPAAFYQPGIATYNSYVFILGGETTNGVGNALSTVYSAKLNTDGTIGSWNTLNTLPVVNRASAAAAYNGYLYIFGGAGNVTGGAKTSTVYSAPINGNGTIGTWATLNTMPAITIFHSINAYNGYFFLVGGSPDGSGYVSTVYSVPAKADGTIGTWSTLNPLPQVLGQHTANIANGYLYIVGGDNGSSKVSTVYSASLKADGTIGSWATLNTLPTVRYQHSSVISNGYLVVIGGHDGSAVLSTVYSTPVQSNALAFNAGSQSSGNLLDVWNNGSSKFSVDINGIATTASGLTINPASTTPSAQFASSIQGITAGSTGTYQTVTNLPARNYGAMVTSYNGYVYVVAGHGTSTTVFSTVYSSKVNADGTLGPWISLNTLPGTRYLGAVTSYGGYIFVAGGHDGAATTSTVYSAKLNSDGTIGTWNTLNTLPALFFTNAMVANNGYLYHVGGFQGGFGQISAIYSAPILVDGKIGTWSTLSVTLPAVRNTHAVSVYNNYMFVTGGHNGGTAQSTVYSAPFKADGTIGSFATLTALPTILDNHASVAINGYLYVVGGTTDDTNSLSAVYTAKINSDGTIGSWAVLNTIPAPVYNQGLVTSNGYMFVVGGFNSTQNPQQQSAVYSVPLQSTAFAFNTINTQTSGNLVDVWNNGQSKFSIDYNGNVNVAGQFQSKVVPTQDGILGSWQTLNTLPIKLETAPTVVGSNGYIYVLGGFASPGGDVSTVYSAKINSDGTIGTWSTLNTLPTRHEYGAAVAYNNYIYLTGGYNASSVVSTVYSVQTKPDGTIGTWATLNTLPAIVQEHAAVAYNGYLFVLGGTSNAAGQSVSTVYSAQIMGDGTIGTWATLNTMPSLTYIHKAVAYNGYIFVTGGVNSSGTVLSTVYSTPIKSDGTIGTWQTLNALPAITSDTVSFAYNGYLYVGGGNNGAYLSTLYTAAIKTDGTIGSWATLSTLPQALARAMSVTYNGYVFLIGGEVTSSGTAISTVYSASLTTSRAFVFNTLTTYPEGTSLGGSASLITIQNNGDAKFNVDAQGNGRFAGQVFAAGAILGAPGQVGDLAENVPVSDESIEAGDLVSAASEGLVKSTGAYDNTLIGVISTKPSLEFSPQTPNSRPVALSGRVPVKVNNEGGEIHIGDYLTSSSVPGVAMKATRPGPVVGRALEEPAVGKVLAIISLTYADPQGVLAQLQFTEDGSLVAPRVRTTSLSLSPEVDKFVHSTPESLTDALTRLDQTRQQTATQLADLHTQILGIQTPEVVTTAPLEEEVASHSAVIADLQTRIEELLENRTLEATAGADIALTTPDDLIASASGAPSINTLHIFSNAQALKLTSIDATISGTFRSLADNFLGNTTVSNLTVGPLQLTQNAINTVGTLFIQNSPLAHMVDFFNGKITIDREGLLTTQKLITPTLTTGKLTISDTLGTQAIASGSSTVTIKTPLASPGSKVFITPVGQTSQPLSVTSITPGDSFEVSLPTQTSTDIQFNWVLVQEK